MFNQTVLEQPRLIRSLRIGRILIVPLPAVFLFMLASCATVDANRIAYVGAERFPPSNPDTVKILREEPTQPNERLGEIIVDASVEPSPPIEEVEEKLREEAGKLGADAVVIVYDGIEPVAFINPWWGGTARAIDGRKLVGVAIKYQEEPKEGLG